MAKTALALAVVSVNDQFDGTWSPKTPIPLSYSLGVPNPERDFGYNPLTISRPSDPVEWPSAENSSFYYIDNTHVNATDTNNTYGYPDQPRLTLPEGIFPAGTVMVVKGTGYATGGDGRWTMTFQGTQANPCFFVCEDVGDTVFQDEVRDSGSTHTIYDNLVFNVDRQTHKIQDSSKYITVRNCTFNGPGTDSGNTAVCACSGLGAADRAEYIVWYNNLIHDWGDDAGALQNDYHGFLPGEYSSHVWVLDNHVYNMGGDSIQVGQTAYAGLQRPDHVYISKNHFHDDRENAVDIKSSTDVIISQNVMHGYRTVSSANGEVVIIHDSNERVWCLANDIYDGERAVSITGGVNVYVIMNRIHDMVGTFDYGGPLYEPNTGIHINSVSGSWHILHNSFDDTVEFVGLPTVPAGSALEGNVFGNKPLGPSSEEGWDYIIETSSDNTNMTADYNVYQDIRNRLGPTDYTTLASWQSGSGLDANSVVGNPLYTDPATNDYSLQAGSPAIGLVAVEDSAFATFETDYGLDIRFDYDGNPKPVSNADAGAHQRV